jgi:hypothetical protein
MQQFWLFTCTTHIRDSNSDTSDVLLVASRCIDCAIPTPKINRYSKRQSCPCAQRIKHYPVKAYGGVEV